MTTYKLVLLGLYLLGGGALIVWTAQVVPEGSLLAGGLVVWGGAVLYGWLNDPRTVARWIRFEVFVKDIRDDRQKRSQ